MLTEFDEGKRSCRRRLAGHNERRRKPHPQSHTALSIKASSPLHSDSNTHPSGFTAKGKSSSSSSVFFLCILFELCSSSFCQCLVDLDLMLNYEMIICSIHRRLMPGLC